MRGEALCAAGGDRRRHIVDTSENACPVTVVRECVNVAPRRREMLGSGIEVAEPAVVVCEIEVQRRVEAADLEGLVVFSDALVVQVVGGGKSPQVPLDGA